MQFQLELIQAMRDGKKTQTRRVKQPWQFFGFRCPGSNSTIVLEKPSGRATEAVVISQDVGGRFSTKFAVGRRYAINPPPGPGDKGRMGKAVGSYECVGLREERLQDISEVDCKAESVQEYQGSTPYTPWGFPGREGGWLGPRRAFMGLWNTIAKPGEQFADNPTVFVIEMGEFEWN